MSPLHCNTVQEALWERAASAGPAPLSPALVEHMSSCPVCQSERRAVAELLEASRALADPEPPLDIWDGFEEQLWRSIRGNPVSRAWGRWGRRAIGLAAMLVLGFGLGAVAMRVARPGGDDVATVERRDRLAGDIEAGLRNDARLQSYFDELQSILVAYRASDQDPSMDVFRRSLPSGMVAGPAAPSEADRQRLERQRATREQLRSLVLGMLVTEIESESHGFAYIDRRVASIAGQQLLYFIH
ncbi:MAG TPA: hypothetical protein VFH82_13005 [Gemmatimonadota bacterium]|nr:hypothetical protein [Gemmatimonadota bacterium]